MFEYYLFGWNKNKCGNLSDSVTKKWNNNLKNEFIDIPTALKILDPDLYDNDITSIRNILFNNTKDPKCQEFENKKRNIELTNLLIFMGYDTEDKIIELKKDKSKIYASKDSSNGNVIKCQLKCGNIRTNI